MTPYEDSHNTDSWIRCFSMRVPELELVWHRDLNDRIIEVISESIGWWIQFDDEEPIHMYFGLKFKIPKMVYHRVIRTTNCTGDLVIKIQEF